MSGKIVLCHGVFDLLHVGHIVHLQEARMFGDRLVVSVVADKFIEKTHRPIIYNEVSRVGLLKELRCVDSVVLCQAPGPEQIIENMRPDVYVRGPDYIGKRMPESDILEQLGIPVRYTPSSFRRTTETIEEIIRLFHEGPGKIAKE